MVREFKLPDVGEGLTEAEIVRWLVEVGETVSEDQPVAEVETDKAVVEVPAPVNGTVKEILAEEGEMVPVGTVIITFDVEGETETEAEADAEIGAEADADSAAGTEGVSAPDSEADSVPDGVDPGTASGGRTFAAPATRRIARELGVDIGTVAGSGPGGRVTEADVRAAADSGGEAASEATDEGPTSATRRLDDEASLDAEAESTDEAVEPPTEAASRDRTLAAPATRQLAAEEAIDLDSVPTDLTKDGEAFVTPTEIEAYADAQRRAQEADAEAVSAEPIVDSTVSGEDERIPYRGVRRTIGEQMERSKYTAPHVTHHDEADVTELVEMRSRLKERAEERGSSLSYMPFVIKAVIAGLREYPILNAQLHEEAEEIVVRGEYNVGVAAATDAGLMVPVLKHADRKGLLQLADELNELVSKARGRSISREEMQGGTFSITNFGAIGGEYATPIINYPETAILGLGAIKEKPRVVDGDVVPRTVLTLSLSIDHRVIDGAEAARFTNCVKSYIQQPEKLLLE
ncbi:2-oxo acid dehydrogenase subunit E2 [Natronomonas salsuginis]|uniref:2-oxo acid dehydrogenase subunit E2 n=1 Tax=Natronomonas salsuginis TaxID=2217661 RepID=A0A4U5J6R8_9EURY|nr:2-oxo acid dehydrogenase subunit E2 [Natronomonas salsuginis]TKR24314.1 2-oxo acid dehydrogenase subunit E2 [Natronomonas salsuginis]